MLEIRVSPCLFKPITQWTASLESAEVILPSSNIVDVRGWNDLVLEEERSVSVEVCESPAFFHILLQIAHSLPKMHMLSLQMATVVLLCSG